MKKYKYKLNNRGIRKGIISLSKYLYINANLSLHKQSSKDYVCHIM